jgi:hypothetical protein
MGGFWWTSTFSVIFSEAAGGWVAWVSEGAWVVVAVQALTNTLRTIRTTIENQIVFLIFISP